MEQQHGVQESKEMLVAVMALAAAMVKAAKDGIQITDLAVLISDENLKGALAAAAEGMTKIPAEMGELTLSEGLELAMTLIQGLPAVIEAGKK